MQIWQPKNINSGVTGRKGGIKQPEFAKREREKMKKKKIASSDIKSRAAYKQRKYVSCSRQNVT